MYSFPKKNTETIDFSYDFCDYPSPYIQPTFPILTSIQPYLAIFPVKRNAITGNITVSFCAKFLPISPVVNVPYISRSSIFSETFTSIINAFPRREGLLTIRSERPLPDTNPGNPASLYSHGTSSKSYSGNLFHISVSDFSCFYYT